MITGIPVVLLILQAPISTSRRIVFSRVQIHVAERISEVEGPLPKGELDLLDQQSMFFLWARSHSVSFQTTPPTSNFKHVTFVKPHEFITSDSKKQITLTALPLSLGCKTSQGCKCDELRRMVPNNLLHKYRITMFMFNICQSVVCYWNPHWRRARWPHRNLEQIHDANGSHGLMIVDRSRTYILLCDTRQTDTQLQTDGRTFCIGSPFLWGNEYCFQNAPKIWPKVMLPRVKLVLFVWRSFQKKVAKSG